MRKRTRKKLLRAGICPRCRRNDTSRVLVCWWLKSGRFISELSECWGCGYGMETERFKAMKEVSHD